MESGNGLAFISSSVPNDGASLWRSHQQPTECHLALGTMGRGLQEDSPAGSGLPAQNTRFDAGPGGRDLVKTRRHPPAVQLRCTENPVNSAESHPEGQLCCWMCPPRMWEVGADAGRVRRAIPFTIRRMPIDTHISLILVERRNSRPIMGRYRSSLIRIISLDYRDLLWAGH